MNVKKQAAKDAAEFARAQMFYGEGAGTRRKLIKAVVHDRMANSLEYHHAFNDAYNKIDMSKYARNAVSERARKDLSKKVGRNVRGIVKGNKQSLTTGVALAIVVGTWAHNEGHDEKVVEYAKSKARQVRYSMQRARMRHKVTKIRDVLDD
jgi:hypothetical protein